MFGGMSPSIAKTITKCLITLYIKYIKYIEYTQLFIYLLAIHSLLIIVNILGKAYPQLLTNKWRIVLE